MIDLALFFNGIKQEVILLFGLALLDMLLGVGLALWNKEFDWSRLTDYIQSNGFPIVGWIVAEFILALPVEIIPASFDVVPLTLVKMTVFAKILASIVGHLGRAGVIPRAPLEALNVLKPEGDA